MDIRAITKVLATLSPMQRKAFLLLVLEHAATALEVPDRGRNDGYKRAPRFDAMLARRWRALAGVDAPIVEAAPNPSVAHLFPEGTLSRRFAELLDCQALPEDGTVDDDEMLLRLQQGETEQAAAWVFDAATLALSVLDADDPFPLFAGDALGSVQELYDLLGARDVVGAHVETCLTFASEFSGSVEAAARARVEARARAAAVFAS